jgi:maltooligosyltrehalose trehalohydrolase
LPLTAFITFLQNHDQIGNRAFGERITKLADPRAIRAASAILLLAPSPPLLFMGEEFGAETPFLFFCDFNKTLAAAVTAGRRDEFSHFAKFRNAAERARIPDPNAASTFAASHLDWSTAAQPHHAEWLGFYRKLLKLRSEYIVPRLYSACRLEAHFEVHGGSGLSARWRFADNYELILLANLGTAPLSNLTTSASHVIYASEEVSADIQDQAVLPPWSVVWFLEP